MIRRSPAEQYIKYLILHSKKYSDAAIREILRYAQLDYLGDWCVKKLREALRPPDPFDPFHVDHGPSHRFLLAEGLKPLFHPDEHGKRAFQILEKPRIKEFVESMIATNAPHAAIQMAVSRQYRFTCTTTVIDRYKDFFWNIDLVDSTELRALLQLRVDELENHPDPEIKLQHKAMRNAYYKDSRKTAADLPFSPLSALISQMRMGMMPSRIDLSKVLEQTRNLATVRTFEAVSYNGKGDSSRALDYSSVLANVTKTLGEVVKPDDQLRDQLSTIAMRTDNTQIPNVHTLSLGQHTVEVTKMESTNGLSADVLEGDGSDDDVGEPGG